MRISALISLLSASLASAAAINSPPTHLLSRNSPLNNTLPTNTTIPLSNDTLPANITLLGPDDILVYGQGRMEVMNRTYYESIKHQHFELTTDTPSSINGTVVPYSNATGAVANAKREALAQRDDCQWHEVYTINPTEKFLNWDVPMSSVVHATGNSLTVAVTEGYSIANSISVGASAAYTPIEKILTLTLSIDYTRSWTSTYSAAYSFGVPFGKYAAVVSNPSTTRVSGKVDYGCVGNPSESYEFHADSYTSHGYSNLNWVDGTISLCTGDTWPLHMCLGDGTL
ncbi:hypothetical protein BP5796_06231 [Coleophoma crateriformis]|uniref:Celp0028 effector like protein n=1 Tax=Coleophoma crateriformis TaxID=565419 RepID=A0A3D8RWC2_9HELO|nr:hypothetical protein BP5796_06231 [Coleophoma crateriformis]